MMYVQESFFFCGVSLLKIWMIMCPSDGYLLLLIVLSSVIDLFCCLVLWLRVGSGQNQI